MAAAINASMRNRFAALCIAAACAQPALAAAETHTILMEGVAFVPQTLTVKPGDVVVWVNKDLFPHTATAQNRKFDSGEIAPGKTWKYTAKKPGKFSYVCTLHPTMKATLVVK
jgi:plastocyanin